MYIRLMRRSDVAQVAQIDREAFPTDWPPTNFARELENRLAYYIVVTEGNSPPPPPPPRSLPDRPEGFLARLKRALSVHEDAPPEIEGQILGYAGMWILADEAHIMSIASRQEARHTGVGEALLTALIDLAQRHKARVVTLEVRISNTIAQNLYEKYGFQKVGTRKGYYLDNKEDALIMTTDNINSPAFQERLRQLRAAHLATRGPTVYDVDKLDVKLG